MRDLSENSRRAPAVAGMFYPADPGELVEMVARALDATKDGVPPAPPRAIISPHAGYVYSGRVAATAWNATAQADVRHAVVLSPSHRVAFSGIALPSGGAFAMPGFDLPINADARTALVAEGLADVFDPAHDREHGAETQFPFLHALHPSADVLPLVLGQARDEHVAAAVDFLDGFLDHPLFVLSSDLSHFLTLDAARAHDDEAARLIETGHWRELTGAHACGAGGIRGFFAARAGQGVRPTRLARATSADVSGDTSRVVGYGAWTFHGPEGDAINEGDRHTLLRVARESLTARTRQGYDPEIDVASFGPRLATHGAAFVTLTKHGDLRGCIGSLKAHQPLVQDVAQNAIKAGHADPRFVPVNLRELDDIRLKIAVLGPPAPMAFTGEEDLLARLRPGEDGLILSDLGHRSTFLPMVWETLPDRHDFLRHLKQKAGLPPDYWSDTLKMHRYRAESFAEPAR